MESFSPTPERESSHRSHADGRAGNTHVGPEDTSSKIRPFRVVRRDKEEVLAVVPQPSPLGAQLNSDLAGPDGPGAFRRLDQAHGGGKGVL